VTESRYVIGIDLGTTNSVVAFTESALVKGKKPEIRVLDIPQLISEGNVEKRCLLPSFMLLPGPHEMPEDALRLPWNPENRHAIGVFAKERGAEIPHRLIASAKSWLCHTLVDRNKPILPWEGPDDMRKLSPVEASAAILSHIRDAWNHAVAQGDPELDIANQDIFLTVPASFDAVARELTVQASGLAGLRHITLLEEPQAAFYAWIDDQGDQWRNRVEKGDLILVCDIGGGTSDFSLIQVSESDGDLVLERVAVGNHLLVGGDNMDLALAYNVSQMLGARKKLNAWQMRSLWHACRRAKEHLLGSPDALEYPVTLLGSGSKLIGGTQKVMLTKEMVQKIIVDGFFPNCGLTDAPASLHRAGIQEVGLAYESDPAVTRHLARFISQQAHHNAYPTAVLFNGGVMKSPGIRTQVMETISSWLPAGKRLREIATRDYDLTVARGAAYYGLAKRHDGIRIRSGLNKAYYMGVAASLPAVPGMPVPIKALCVAPFGMEEGTGDEVPNQEFVLLVGEPVKFDFLGSNTRLDDVIGTVVDEWDEDIQEITTMETTLDGEAGSPEPVVLQVKVTEIGTLEIWCVSKADPDRRWKLAFSVREQNGS